MVAYAYIEDGVVKERFRVDPFTIVVPSYAALFVEVPDEVDQGWLFDGENFSPPPPVEIPEVVPPTKEELLAQLQALQAQIEALGE